MEYSLPCELVRQVEGESAIGRYQSRDELIEQAMRRFPDERQLGETRWSDGRRFPAPLIGASGAERGVRNNSGMQETITRDAEVMHGTPVFRGTRVPLQTLFDYLENGDSLDAFLEGFPTISRELAVQVLEEWKELRLARV